MIFLYINGSDRTADLQAISGVSLPLKRINHQQARSDTLDFTLFRNAQPSVNQDVKFYVGDTVASILGAVITLNGFFERNTNKFYAGQKLWLRIGQTNAQQATVQSYNESTLQVTLTAAPSITINAGDRIGEILFGGVVSKPKNINLEVLANLEYPTQCVDYTKIFDKKNVAATWANVDSRYIINDFVNSTVNYNFLVDNLSYASNGAIQAAWAQASDGNAPTIDASDYLESTSAGVFGWTHAGGTASWSSTISTKNISDWVGVNSGLPTKGQVMLWMKPADYTKITAIKLRVGSSSGNYDEVSLSLPTSNNWQYVSASLAAGTLTGNPNWISTAYAAIVITETGSSSIKLNGFRINADNSFTLYNVQATSPVFTNLSASNDRPVNFMQILAKNSSYVWDIDYNRDIHFTPNTYTPTPYNLGDTTNNFYDLQVELDQSNLYNSVVVTGGTEVSTSVYAQVVQGDNQKREWVLKSPFANLAILLDDNTSSHSAEAGTTTTNVKITGHGLHVGDSITNRTRSNSVSTVSVVVDANNVTIFPGITSQTNGDTITFYTTAKTVGQEGVDVEASFDFMYNSSNQSVRCSSQTATPLTTTFLRFAYNEVLTISIKYTDPTSANTLKSMGFGDGIFEANPIVDSTLQSLSDAVALAQATINDTKNAITIVTFRTNQDGLRAGQIIQIQDSVRGINNSYVVQKVELAKISGFYNDYFEYSVEAGTTLFGVIEFYQKLLAAQAAIAGTTNTIVTTYVDELATVGCHDDDATALGGFKFVKETKTVGCHDADNCYITANGGWEWEPEVTQPIPTRWDLFAWG